MIETLSLGSSPVNEPCAQTTDPDYGLKASNECHRYLNQLHRHYEANHDGNSLPLGCKLLIKGSMHDYGTYYEVAVKFDASDPYQLDAAYWLESNCPLVWDEEKALSDVWQTLRAALYDYRYGDPPSGITVADIEAAMALLKLK